MPSMYSQQLANLGTYVCAQWTSWINEWINEWIRKIYVYVVAVVQMDHDFMMMGSLYVKGSNMMNWYVFYQCNSTKVYIHKHSVCCLLVAQVAQHNEYINSKCLYLTDYQKNTDFPP